MLPSWAKNDAEIGPDGQWATMRPSEPSLDRFWTDCESMFDRFVVDFRRLLGACTCPIAQHTMLLHLGGQRRGAKPLEITIPRWRVRPRALRTSHLVLRSSFCVHLSSIEERGGGGQKYPLSRRVKAFHVFLGFFGVLFCGFGRVLERTFASMCSFLCAFLLFSILLGRSGANFLPF